VLRDALDAGAIPKVVKVLEDKLKDTGESDKKQ
jgi:hypothetical protein